MTALLANWRLILFAVVLGALGVQSYRLQGVQGTLTTMEQKENDRVLAEQKQALASARNKERTDAQYQLDLRAARAARVRAPTGRYFVAAAPGGGDKSAACFDPGELNRELTEWVTRVAGRLSRTAEQAEEVAAAYRACAAWGREVGGLLAPRAPEGGQTTGTGVVAARTGLPR